VIRRHPLLDAFEEDQRRQPVDYHRNLRIYDGLWREARALGFFAKATLEGIETDIEYARVINGRRPLEKGLLRQLLRERPNGGHRK
jgi:hypothetical protein